MVLKHVYTIIKYYITYFKNKMINSYTMQRQFKWLHYLPGSFQLEDIFDNGMLGSFFF